MWLKNVCVAAALAAMVTTLAACNGGGYGGVPTTPDVPGSVDSGPDMPEATESAEPPPQGGPVVAQPLGTPVPNASSPPSGPSASASPAASPLFVPHAGATTAFTLSSATFKNDAIVPRTMVYKGNGCSGDNTSPELHWTGAPKKAKSFAVVMLDTTTMLRAWELYGIAKTATSLPRNAAAHPTKFARQILRYGGPCAARGKAHRYVFTLYALDTALRLPRSARAEDLDVAMRGHILGTAAITAVYKK